MAAFKPSRKWTRRADARPEEILEAALAEFVERGFEGARMEDIARRAGLSKAGVYLYFESKDALLKALIESRMTPLIQEALSSGMANAADPKMALKMIATADGEFSERERQLLDTVQSVFGVAVDLDPLAPITPEALASNVRDPSLRRQLVRGMVILSLIDGEASPGANGEGLDHRRIRLAQEGQRDVDRDAVGIQRQDVGAEEALRALGEDPLRRRRLHR